MAAGWGAKAEHQEITCSIFTKERKYEGLAAEHMEHLVSFSVKEGATIATGGKRLTEGEFSKGYWFETTVLTGVTQNMTIVHEESFGPILPVLKFKTFEEVIGYAKDCEYGLAAMVFTNDMNTIMKCNDELEYGEIYKSRSWRAAPRFP